MNKEFFIKSNPAFSPSLYQHPLPTKSFEVVKRVSKWKYSITSVFKFHPINASANAYNVLHSNSKAIWDSNILLPKIGLFIV